MLDPTLLAHGAGGSGGSTLASWNPLFAILGGFVVVVIALSIRGGRRGRSGVAGFLLRPADGLEDLTGIPGWAAAMVGTSLYALLLAGYGFYSDVAWHIALGRDEELFTAPHTAIVLGLAMIGFSAVLGVAYATWSRARTGVRIGPLQVPWSAIPLGLLGGSALCGFPLDEVWHHMYGIDVTMWSPTHMLMILGASLSPLACWLALAEAGVSPADGGWARFAHVLAGWLTLMGLGSSQGEFAFGVPQFQQLFHPVLVMLAGGFAFVAIRLVLGRFWALGIAAFSLLFEGANLLGPEGGGPAPARAAGFYIASALVVEVVAWVLGTEDRRRFAIVSGLGVGTVGLAGEWIWNQNAYQPWTTALLPDAVILGVIAAVGSAVIATAFGACVRDAGRSVGVRPGFGAAALALAGLGILFTLAWPMPRTSGEVTAIVDVTDVGEDVVGIHVTLDPADAAADARWFQAIAWQGGDFHSTEMRRVGPGSFVSAEPMPIGDSVKTLVRLHRGSEMMAVPVYLPADPEIEAPEVPAVDRTVPFRPDTEYLMREAHPGPPWFSTSVYIGLAILAAAWITAFAWAASRIEEEPGFEPAPGVEEPVATG